MREEGWQKLLREERVARLATHSDQGRIHLVPVCYAYDGRDIFIGTSMDSKKVRNVKRNSSVAFVVDFYVEDWSKLKGVMIQGKAEVVEGGRVFEGAKKLLYEKYPQYEASAPIEEGQSVIIKITPEKIVAWDYES